MERNQYIRPEQSRRLNGPSKRFNKSVEGTFEFPIHNKKPIQEKMVTQRRRWQSSGE